MSFDVATIMYIKKFQFRRVKTRFRVTSRCSGAWKVHWNTISWLLTAWLSKIIVTIIIESYAILFREFSAFDFHKLRHGHWTAANRTMILTLNLSCLVYFNDSNFALTIINQFYRFKMLSLISFWKYSTRTVENRWVVEWSYFNLFSMLVN